MEKLKLDVDSEGVRLSIPVQETQPPQHTPEEILPGPPYIYPIEETIKLKLPQHTTMEILPDPPYIPSIEKTIKSGQGIITPSTGSYVSSHTDSYEIISFVTAFSDPYQYGEQLALDALIESSSSASASYRTASEERYIYDQSSR